MTAGEPASPPDGGPKVTRLRLREFDWAGLVRKGTFENMAFGIVGAGIGLVVLQSPSSGVPDWLLVDVTLSCVCVFLAYLRTWKTAREEEETADLWMGIERSPDSNDEIVNRVFEFPYLFSISILPFTAAAPQFFMATLIVFYAVDNYYNAALARGVAALASLPPRAKNVPSDSANVSGPKATGGWPGYVTALLRGIRRTFWVTPGEQARFPAGNTDVGYFRTRFRYNVAFMVILLVAFLAVWAEKGRNVALPLDPVTIALIAVTLVAFGELVVEPHRNLGMRFEPADAADKGGGRASDRQ